MKAEKTKLGETYRPTCKRFHLACYTCDDVSASANELLTVQESGNFRAEKGEEYLLAEDAERVAIQAKGLATADKNSFVH